MNRNLCFTLSFNLISETEGAVKRLYEQNDRNDFDHWIVDCDWPLIEGDKIPDDLDVAKATNTQSLKHIADKYGSGYIKINNEGVSQNWTQVYNVLKPDDTDVMTCVEPDEEAIEHHWIKALGDVLRSPQDNFGYGAPTLADNKDVLKRSRYAELMKVAGHNIYLMRGSVNYGLLSISGRLLNRMGGVPVPKITEIYGNIESPLLQEIKKYNMQWFILKDFYQIHTNIPKLYRAWKDDCIFGKFKDKQIHFEEWLKIQQ